MHRERLVMASFAGLLAACSSGGGAAGTAAGVTAPGVAVVGSAAKVRPLEPVDGAAGAALVAARNEFEAFQVVAVAGSAPLRNLSVFAGPLAGPGGAAIPPENVVVYRVGYVDVETPSDLEGAPGPWPDPLIPAVDPLVGEARAAFPIDVPAGENRVAWVEVLVPEDATPGIYEGTVEVVADGFAATVPVELTVLAFTLPSSATLQSSYGLSRNTCVPLGLEGCGDPEVRAAARELFVRAALDHRITLGHPHTAQNDARGEADLARFRDHFLPYLEGTGETRLPGARLTSYLVNRVSERDVGGWKEELERQGFGAEAIVWSCDEPFFFPVYGEPGSNWEVCLDRLEADQAVWPEARKLVTAHIQTATNADALGLIDVLVVNVEFLHGPEDSPWYVGDQRRLYDDFLATPGKELWLYSACGSHGCTRNDDPYTTGWAGGYQIDSPASETRAMGWLAHRYRMDGVIYYDTVLQLASAWEDPYRYTGNGEGTLFYPGSIDRIGGTTPVPVPSIRLKNLRDGFEEYEYLAFLDRNGIGGVAEQLSADLFPAPYDTARTDDELQAARRALAAEVASVTGGPLARKGAEASATPLGTASVADRAGSPGLADRSAARPRPAGRPRL